MYGEIPFGLYKLQDLIVLRLDDTLEKQDPWIVDPNEGFTGSLTTHIGGMKDLRWLLLNNNPISGTM